MLQGGLWAGRGCPRRQVLGRPPDPSTGQGVDTTPPRGCLLRTLGRFAGLIQGGPGWAEEAGRGLGACKCRPPAPGWPAPTILRSLDPLPRPFSDPSTPLPRPFSDPSTPLPPTAPGWAGWVGVACSGPRPAPGWVGRLPGESPIAPGRVGCFYGPVLQGGLPRTISPCASVIVRLLQGGFHGRIEKPNERTRDGPWHAALRGVSNAGARGKHMVGLKKRINVSAKVFGPQPSSGVLVQARQSKGGIQVRPIGQT